MNSSDFLGGVVEGFYGRPWTRSQRLELFGRMSDWGLNTYFYAPKDDLKHRALWREAYDEEELNALHELIDACAASGIQFVYGLSPGLDIEFSNATERDTIRRRFGQLNEVGCRHFALLFDDLPGQMNAADRRTYASVAEAQCSVTNDILAAVKQHAADGRLLFCPTPYCERMARSHLGGPDYLDLTGQQLDAAIDVFWTGPEIISGEISIESIQRLSERLRRAPIIWDNLHANDYDGNRVFVGPYSGRATELKSHLRGILINPNNEYPINFVAFHTFAAFVRGDGAWDARAAYQAALDAWMPAYATIGEDISRDELTLLADCFYLPFDDGQAAQQLLSVAARLIERPVSEWGDDESRFVAWNRQIQTVFDKLTQLRDRELFYAWSRPAWDLKEEMQLIEGYLAKKKQGEPVASVETHLPGTYHGGFAARLQRLLLMDDEGRFRPANESGNAPK